MTIQRDVAKMLALGEQMSKAAELLKSRDVVIMPSLPMRVPVETK